MTVARQHRQFASGPESESLLADLPSESHRDRLPRRHLDEGHEVARLSQQILCASPYRDIRGVTCSHQAGVLTLRGVVNSYHSKQLAQELVREVPSVRWVCNQVEVADWSAATGQTPGRADEEPAAAVQVRSAK